jgi:hypothetical protein
MEVLGNRTIRSAVKTLVLVDNSIEIPEDESEDEEDWVDDGGNGDEHEEQHNPGNQSPESNEQLEAEEEATANALRMQEQMRFNGEDRRLLTQLFSKCGRKSLKSIAFHSHREGNNFIDLEMDGDEEPSFDDHCFNTVMLAIIASGASFDTFSMNVGECQGIPISGYTFDLGKEIMCKVALTHFRILDLTINARYCDDDGRRDVGREFMSVISKLNIRSLKITGPIHIWTRPTLGMLMGRIFPSIRSLEFDEVKVNWKRLVPFLRRQKNLRVLILKRSKVSIRGLKSDFPKWRDAQDELSRLTGKPELQLVST